MATTSSDTDVAPVARGQTHRATTGMSRWQKAVGIMGLAVLLWVGNNLFDTITSDGMRGGGSPEDHAPGGRAPTTLPVVGDEPAPAGGDDGEHDPSQFDHD